MTLPPVGSALKYLLRGRLHELVFRGRLYLAEEYGAIKYSAARKLNRDKFKIVTVNGSKMIVHLDDNGISKDLYLYGGRELFAVRFLESFLKEDDVVIDIGANIGFYTLLERKIAKNGHVFASEPVPFNRKLLEMNLDLNGINDVHVLPFAFGDGADREREFYIYDRMNWASFRKDLGTRLLRTMQIRTISLDDFIDKYLEGRCPGLVRMDVEGHEYEIIKGARRALAHCPNLKIFMEIHPHLLSAEQLDELLTTLQNNHFEVRAIINECRAHEYRFLNEKIWASIESIPYGVIGAGYERLRSLLPLNKGTEVFFEKSSCRAKHT